LRQLIQRLADAPHRGKPGRVYGTRELVTPRIGKTASIIVYRVQGDRLEILRVLFGMRDIGTILRDELFLYQFL
jgi:plasmid stabilization system protein ParE